MEDDGVLRKVGRPDREDIRLADPPGPSGRDAAHLRTQITEGEAASSRAIDRRRTAVGAVGGAEDEFGQRD